MADEYIYVVTPSQQEGTALTWTWTIFPGINVDNELTLALGVGAPYWILPVEEIHQAAADANGLEDALEWDYTGSPVTGQTAGLRAAPAAGPVIDLEKAKQIQTERITVLITPWIEFLTVIQADAITAGDMPKAQKCLADQNALIATRTAVTTCTTVQQVKDCYTMAEAEVARIKQEYGAEPKLALNKSLMN